MLRDFLQLEEFYGSIHAAQPFKELNAKYDIGSIREAIKQGLLKMHILPCGFLGGDCFLYLTEAGRRLARHEKNVH